MKQIKKKLILLMMCLCVTFGGAACDLFDMPSGDDSGVTESNSNNSSSDDCAHSGGTPTCTEKPTCSICGEKYGEALNHAYDVENIAWAWVDDGSSATATITCKNDATHKVEKTATITSEITTSAGCEEMGTTTYTATIEHDGTTYTATKAVQDVAVKQHAYDVENIAWAWVDDGSSATATITCKNDAEHKIEKTATITSEITTPAGCEEMGTTTYTATIEYNETTYTATKAVQNVAATQHDYDVQNIAWAWADDGLSATATITCKNDAEHKIEKTASITSKITTPAGCEEMGTTTYTATIEYDGNTYTATKDIQDIEAKKHAYGAWDSNGDNTHTRVCENDSEHTETLNCNGGAATCQAKAVCVDCGKEYGDYADHDVQWVKDDAEKDVKKCAAEGCNKVEKEFIKTVTAENQELMATNNAAVLDVAGCSAYESVVSIMLGTVSLGTNPSVIDLTQVTDKALHGVQTIILTVKDTEGETHEVSVPVTIVTQMVSTAQELYDITRTATDTTNNAIFGYYKLANDINCTAAPYWAGFNNSVSFDNNEIAGFRGTLDGDGHTLTGFIHANGLFGQVNFGATIKDITFVSTKNTGSATAVIGNASKGTTYENVNFVLYNSDGTKYPKSVIFAQGWANVMKGVTVKVYAGADSTSEYADVGSLFGNWHWIAGTTYADKYENVMVYCASL
ncbi:MAG: hypothetical protein E7349_07260, partial [Clostridiales bacterium]|nr:hypothetical protein [Clostridiales bacterium]